MVILTRRFATLLLAVAVVHAAYIPQHPAAGTQVHFRPRTIPDSILPTNPIGLFPSLNPFGSHFLGRRLSSPSPPENANDNKPRGKGRRPSKFGTASVPAPIPNSARPASEKKFHKTITDGHKRNVTAPVNVADFSNQLGVQDHSQGVNSQDEPSQDKHGEYHGEKHKGYKSGHHQGYEQKYHNGYSGEHHGSSKGESFNGQDKHEPEDKRDTVEAATNITLKRVNSRLFGRTSTSEDLSGMRYYVKKAHTDHDHGHDHGHAHEHIHDHDHDHDHDHRHVHEHIHDHDHDHDRDHDHDHRRRDILDNLLNDSDNDFGESVILVARTPGGQPEQTSAWEGDDLNIDVSLKRGIENTSRRRHHQNTQASLLARRHYPIVIHDIGHNHRHSHVTYHVTGKREIVTPRDHEDRHRQGRREITPGVPGTISIVSPTVNSAKPLTVASLVLSATNGTSKSTPTNASFVLNASNETRTKVFLVPTDSKSTNGTMHVTIQIPIFEGQQVQDVPWCAFYDPAPSKPGPLGVSRCGEKSAHSSQLFEYSVVSGTVRPIWNSISKQASDIVNSASVADQTPFERLPVNDEFRPEFAAVSNSTSTNVTAAGAAVEPLNSTRTESLLNTTHAPPSENPPPRTVALVFTPDDPQAPKVASENAIPVQGSSNNTEAASPLAVSVSSTISGIINATGTISFGSSTVSAQNIFAASSVKSDSVATHTSLSSKSPNTLSAAAVAQPSTPLTSSSTTTSSVSVPKIAAAEATSAQALDAGAPYEWMFTPGEN